MKEKPNYQSYLLRLWREDEHLPWRATLQNPHTGEQEGFASLERLFTFLRQQTTVPDPPEDPT